MFTIEMRINGVLVSTIYGRNIGVDDTTNRHKYLYELYRPESGVQKGFVAHHREEGIERLTQIVLDDAIGRGKV